MKNFFLLMALVLTAGVVHAQGVNFGNRTNLTQAQRLDAAFPTSVNNQTGTGSVNGVNVTYLCGWDNGEKKLYWSGNPGGEQEVEIFNSSYLSNNLNGRYLLDVYENFVIRAKDDSEWKHYYGRGNSGDITSNSNDNSAVSYAVCFYSGTTLLSKMQFWSGDVKIAPLRALCKEDKATELTIQEINSINRVTIKSNSPNGQVYFEEAYFISALPGLDFTDRNGIDIGNAYIDPSYLIRSNHLWVEINDGTNNKPNDRTFYMVADGSNKGGTLSFSLPYWNGIDMSEVTFTALDFVRDHNVLSRCIYENIRRDLHRNPTNNGSAEYQAYKEKAKDVLVRGLYNSRYNGSFYDQIGGYALDLSTRGDVYLSDKAIKHVNSIYWQSVSGNSVRKIFCQDMSFTKNTIKARTTRKPLEPNMWPLPDVAGFRSKLDYPIHPYYENEGNWSDVVRGDWDDGEYGGISRTQNCADFSRYDKMRITGSPNTSFDIRFSTKASVDQINSRNDLQVIVVKTDAHGEVNVDLTYYEHFLLHAILFHNDINNQLGLYDLRSQLGRGATENTDAVPGLRDNLWVNNVELFEGEGRLVDLVGSSDYNNTANMYHVYNVDNNYQWQYGTIVRWAVNQGGQSQFTQDNNVSNGAVIWGSMGLYPENYADLTGYKAIRVYSDSQISSNAVRFVFNTLYNKDGTTTRQDIPVPLNKAVDNHHYYPELDGLYYAELDISNYEYFHLNGIKALAGFEVKAIKLVEDEEADYIFYGNGSYGEQGKAKIDPTAAAATNDQAAKVIDTRARCNNMQEEFNEGLFGSGIDKIEHLSLQKPANPNLLFITRTNQFEGIKVGKTLNSAGYEEDVVDNYNLIAPSNKNFSTDGSSEYFTANEIRLEDGFSFYAPKQINAAQAKYTRTFKNTIDAVNSIILPFAVEAGNTPVTESKFGFYETTETLKSTTAQNSVVGILNEQTANEGDWLIQFQKKTGTTKANKPYLYAVAANTGTKEFTGAKTGDNVIISATPDVKTKAIVNMTNNESETNTFDYYLRGVYESTYIDDILFYGTDGTLYRTPYMTVTPFRTIFKSPITVIEDDIDTEDDEWKDSQTDYFTPANGVKVVLAINPNDDSSDINEVIADGLFAEDEPIYNVAGQRVNTFGKGIYIVGGKKILVK